MRDELTDFSREYQFGRRVQLEVQRIGVALLNFCAREIRSRSSWKKKRLAIDDEPHVKKNAPGLAPLLHLLQLGQILRKLTYQSPLRFLWIHFA